MLPTLRKELPSKPVAAFDLVCSLPPLPLCGAVSDKTHVSFRTKCAAAAKRSKEHTKSSEVHAPPYRSRKVSFSPAVRGLRGNSPSLSLGVSKGVFSSTKRISPLILRRGAAAGAHRCRPARLSGALPFRASVRAPSSASGPSSCAPMGNSESCCKSSVWSRRKRM